MFPFYSSASCVSRPMTSSRFVGARHRSSCASLSDILVVTLGGQAILSGVRDTFLVCYFRKSRFVNLNLQKDEVSHLEIPLLRLYTCTQTSVAFPP